MPTRPLPFVVVTGSWPHFRRWVSSSSRDTGSSSAIRILMPPSRRPWRRGCAAARRSRGPAVPARRRLRSAPAPAHDLEARAASAAAWPPKLPTVPLMACAASCTRPASPPSTECRRLASRRGDSTRKISTSSASSSRSPSTRARTSSGSKGRAAAAARSRRRARRAGRARGAGRAARSSSASRIGLAR